MTGASFSEIKSSKARREATTRSADSLVREFLRPFCDRADMAVRAPVHGKVQCQPPSALASTQRCSPENFLASGFHGKKMSTCVRTARPIGAAQFHGPS